LEYTDTNNESSKWIDGAIMNKTQALQNLLNGTASEEEIKLLKGRLASGGDFHRRKWTKKEVYFLLKAIFIP
jgi:hypothetical protein